MSQYLTICIFCLPQDQGGFGIAISEKDTTNGVVIKSLTDNGAAAKVWEHLKSNKGMKNVFWSSIHSSYFLFYVFQDGRIKVGDVILAVDDEIVVGYPVEKVLLKCQECYRKHTA